jgi:hypothetical protein
MNRITLTLLLSLVFASAPLAASQEGNANKASVKRIAVLNVENSIRDPKEKSQVTADDIAYLTDAIRQEGISGLPREQYRMMTDKTVLSLGEAKVDECAQENCIVTLGAKIGADFIVQANLGKFRSQYTLSVMLYGTEEGNLLASAEPIESETMEGLLDGIRQKVKSMFAEFVASSAPEQMVAPEARKADALQETEAKTNSDKQAGKAVRLGPLFDIGMNGHWGTHRGTYSYSVGLAVGGGLTIEFPVGDWKIVPELLLNFKNLNPEVENTGGYAYREESMSSLNFELPVLLKTPAFFRETLYALAGPQFRIGLIDWGWDETSKFAVGFVAGLGMPLWDALDLTLRFSMAFDSYRMYDDYYYGDNDYSDTKQYSFLVAIGYYF